MLVVCDATGLEWRILILLSQDPVGIKEINSGADIHSLNQAELVLPSRLIAKKFLFRTIYRGSGYAFAMDSEFKHVSTESDFWDEKNSGFYNKYKGIDECHQHWVVRVMNGKPIIGPSGREWPIERRLDGKIPWTTLTNYPVQGTGADLMVIARVSLRNRLMNGKLRSRLINTIHDSLIVDAPNEEVATVADMMYATFDQNVLNMKKLWGVDSPIPFPCEIKIGHNLGEMKKYERHSH